jgi:poly(3-hydroxybutyrate) depolymerase
MKYILFIVSFLLLNHFSILAQQTENGLTASNGQYIGFLEFKPYDYNNGKNHPLIIFLHGIGERGNGTSDLYKVAFNAIPKYCANGATMQFTHAGQQYSFLVLSPQLSTTYGQWEPFHVEEMIKYAKKNLRIDPDRIYLCGLSLGGGGVWKYATTSAANARGLAAIAPVCATNESVTYCHIASENLPVWAFHAVDDNVVGSANTTYVVNQVNACNPKPGVVPKVKLYDNGGHAIWDRAFDMGHTWQSPQNIYEWFLSNSRNNVTTPPALNKPPVADAGKDISITLPANTAVLDGSASYDIDGTISNYIWTKISGPANSNISNPNAAISNLENLVNGNYVFRLTTKDDKGDIATDDVAITVAAPAVNRPPVANAGSDLIVNLPTNTTTLTGASSYDPDGSIYSYSWTHVGGPAKYVLTNANSANAALSDLIEGTYYFQLIVADNGGSAASDIVVVRVKPGGAPIVNQQPVANAGNDSNISLPTNSITLNGSGSYDPDGKIISYNWTQVGGPSRSTITSSDKASAIVTDLAKGTYYFQLIVADDGGGATVDFVIVTVNDLTSTSAGQNVASGNGARNSSPLTVGNGAVAYNRLKLFPVPATNVLNIQYLAEKNNRLSIIITDASGRQVVNEVWNKDQPSMQKIIDISRLHRGIHYIELRDADGTKLVKAFIKN